MYKPKKAVAAVCAAAILLSPTGALGASPADFVDFPNDWSSQAMTAAVDNGLLGGVGDGRIAPQGQLTRAQMAAIINRAFASEAKASLSGYNDVATDAWYRDDMAKAVQMGTFSGSGGGLLEPDRAITREEAFSVLARAFALESGDAAHLSDFSDGAQVSDWAKGSVAAMVAGGYVNGSDGKRLNPQQSITRAEFAAVMGNLVSQYIDAEDVQKSRSTVIDGNVIIRGSSVDLSGYTINGDIIVADAADSVQLADITTKGRIVVRGASKSLRITDSQANGVVIANPNDAAVLNADDSTLGTLTARSDLTLAGGRYETLNVTGAATISVGEDARVDSITVSADDVTIGGSGTVEKVQADADNVRVNTKGTKVRAGKGTSGVTAGGKKVAAGETVTVTTTGDSDGADNDHNNGNDNNSSDSSNSGTTGGSGSTGDSTGGSTGTTPGGGDNSGSNTGSTPGNDIEAPSATLVNAEQTRLVDLGWSQYVTIAFANGHSLSDSTITIDGTDVTKACTPVSDDDSIAKWEITDLNPAQLTVTSAGESQSVTLSDNANPTTPEVVTDSAPDYMIAHGAVSYFDYYLTNYDADGHVRVEPKKTTFNISGKTASDAPAFYSADAELHEGTNPGDVSGTLTIEFTQKTDADKAWFAAVPENGALKLVAYNDNQNVLNGSLNYTKKADGTITIALGQTNFTSNGRYYVSIQSSGHDTALVPIHVVNAKAPTLSLSGSGSAITSGTNVHFKINDMVYGVTNPTYAAELTRPDGTTVQLEMITDWYQIGDTLVLYNDNNNNIPYNGKYTLTVHSNGFKDMSYSFTVKDGQDAPKAKARSMNVDVVSRATSTGGGESGGGAISANLKFDADLLINAKLLVDLGLADNSAKAINDRWEYEMSGWDSVWSASEDKGYKWTDYINAVNLAEQQGDYLTFAEYAEDAKWDNSGVPYAVKSVLEDNLLGDIQYNGSWIGQAAPALTLVNSRGQAVDAVAEGENIILKGDADYFKKIDSLNINNWSLDLPESDYKISGDTLTIDKDALGLVNPGDNTIVLYADGYRANHLNVTMGKNLETGLNLSVGDITRGQNLRIEVTGSKGDYLNCLSTVTLTKPNGSTTHIYPYGSGSYEDDYYNHTDTVLTIVDNDGSVFDQDGTYTVTLDARYYNSLSATFTVTGEQKTAPQADRAEKSGENYVLHFGESATSDWKNAITSITVNGKTYTEKDAITDLNKNQYQWDNTYGTFDLTLQGKGFNQDENTIVIKATGYADATFKVTKEGALVGATEEPDTPDEQPAPVAPTATVDEQGNVLLTFDKLDSTWRSKVSAVKVNDTTYTKFDWFGDPGENQYEWQESKGQGIDTLYLDKTTFHSGDNTIVVSADGYKDLTVTVQIEDNTDSGETGILEVPAILSYGMSSNTIYFDQSGTNEAAKSYLNALAENGKVTVNGTEYTKSAYSSWLEDNEYGIVNSTDRYIKFDNTAFDFKKDNTIVIEVEGYKTLTLTVHSNGSYQTSTNDPSDSANSSEQDKLAEAPQPVEFEKDTMGFSGNKLYFYKYTGDESLAKAYLKAITDVTVNGDKYTSGKGGYNMSDNVFDNSSASDTDKYLELSTNAFKNDGTDTITIKADGYKDLVVTIDKNGDIVE